MAKSTSLVMVFALLFLFFFQMAGILVESIYILDLMNTSLDEKVLGLLFFFSSALLIPWRKSTPAWLVWFAFGLLFFARGVTPYLDTAGRMLASGVGTGAALLLLPLLSAARPKGESKYANANSAAVGLALAVGLSVLLRTLNFSLDYSTTASGSWVGWGLGLLLGVMLARLEWQSIAEGGSAARSVVVAPVALMLVLTLVYFIFSAPAVLARWSQGSYAAIILAVSFLSLGWAALVAARPRLLENLSQRFLVVWNLLFTLSLLGVTLAQRVSFPPTSNAPAVIVGPPTLLQHFLLALMLLLSPVIFIDLRLCWGVLQQTAAAPGKLAPGMLLGSLALVLLIFMNIFSNVWGYVEPVSPFFRNKFWLPFLLLGGLLTLLAGWLRLGPVPANEQPMQSGISWGWSALLGVIFLGTLFGVARTDRIQPGNPNPTSLVVMTYNIQQANDDAGEKSYQQQLALIQRVAPDILALQESDSARISLNNNDYVRYYASKLGYYTYYGPTTVTGTYGTAILSKYPLLNTHTLFTFSDQDEIGTAVAEIEVSGQRFTIYNVHPDGSEAAMLVFSRTLVELAGAQSRVIALGDYNLRDTDEAYQVVDAVLTNAWTSVYPDKISPDGVDMSSRNRIDHIFVSPDLAVRNPVYVLPPDSATDHPVHWVEVVWGE